MQWYVVKSGSDGIIEIKQKLIQGQGLFLILVGKEEKVLIDALL